MEGIDPLADKVGVLGGEFGSVEACNDADERRVALDVVAPMILAQAEAEDVIKLRFGAGQSYEISTKVVPENRKNTCFMRKTKGFLTVWNLGLSLPRGCLHFFSFSLFHF